MKPSSITLLTGMFEIGHINHPGKKRRLNEDSYDIDVSHGIALLVDGMGGVNAGDIAAAFVRENLYRSLRQGDRPVDALVNTGQALRIQRPQQGTSPCGASAVAVRFDDKTLSSAWLGTCRSLHCNGTKTRVLTPLGTQENKSGGVGTIQALGLTATDKLSLIEAEEAWQRGHALLLCTDELLAACPLDRINDVLCNGRLSAQESAEHLLFFALQGSADNNLSVIVIRRN